MSDVTTDALQPISIAVTASVDWKSYQSGIFDGDGSGNVNHAVLLVGYCSQDGLEYWIVKNSWCSELGLGHIRLPRGVGTCNISTESVILTS